MNKMRTFILTFSFLLSCSSALLAESGDGVLQKVSDALENKQWEQAVGLFRQAISANVEKAEMFYWTGVDKTNDVADKMAQELASYYKNKREYDKASLFYKELLMRKPNDIKAMMACAEVDMCCGKEEDALGHYQRVLELDNDNLQANIFIGNYYYLKAEKEKQRIERDYKKITSPTRMQYARYKNGLSEVLNGGYGKARTYLQKVMLKFPSTEVKKTLERIQVIEKEVNR